MSCFVRANKKGGGGSHVSKMKMTHTVGNGFLNNLGQLYSLGMVLPHGKRRCSACVAERSML